MGRKEKIAERLRRVPKIHQATYKSAVSGKSRKNAVKAFCLECVCWQKEEIRLCSDLGCSLYSYRPYKISKRVDNHSDWPVESTSGT